MLRWRKFLSHYLHCVSKVRENCLLEQFPIACISAPKQASSRYFPPFTQRGNHSIDLGNLEFRIRASPQIIHLNILEIQFYLDLIKQHPPVWVTISLSVGKQVSSMSLRSHCFLCLELNCQVIFCVLWCYATQTGSVYRFFFLIRLLTQMPRMVFPPVLCFSHDSWKKPSILFVSMTRRNL